MDWEGKAGGRNPCTHVAEQSDIGVIPKKGPNKVVCSHAIAEVPEGGLMTKGNCCQVVGDLYSETGINLELA